MENILLILNIIFGLILVLLVLMQKSEGGALGIGVSQESFMFSRSAGNFMTKATAVVATLFIICSLALTIVSRGELTPTSSVLDTIEEKAEDIKEFEEDHKELEAKVDLAQQMMYDAQIYLLKYFERSLLSYSPP